MLSCCTYPLPLLLPPDPQRLESVKLLLWNFIFRDNAVKFCESLQKESLNTLQKDEIGEQWDTKTITRPTLATPHTPSEEQMGRAAFISALVRCVALQYSRLVFCVPPQVKVSLVTSLWQSQRVIWSFVMSPPYSGWLGQQNLRNTARPWHRFYFSISSKISKSSAVWLYGNVLAPLLWFLGCG